MQEQRLAMSEEQTKSLFNNNLCLSLLTTARACKLDIRA